VVVAVSVKTSTAAAPDGAAAQMADAHLGARRVADGVKVSDVQFVP